MFPRHTSNLSSWGGGWGDIMHDTSQRGWWLPCDYRKHTLSNDLLMYMCELLCVRIELDIGDFILERKCMLLSKWMYNVITLKIEY
jgi:hypothetical protein